MKFVQSVRCWRVLVVIGKEMLKRVTDKYKDYLRIVVVSYNDEIEFYEHCGFEKADDASPMFITDLWTWLRSIYLFLKLLEKISYFFNFIFFNIFGKD